MEPLALGPDWHDPLPLISIDEALELSLLASGLSRETLLTRLFEDVDQPWLHPLLWVLPRRWRLAPAALPPRLQGLNGALQEGLVSPVFLVALVDDLTHLWPPEPAAPSTAISRWLQESIGWHGQLLPLPGDLEGLLASSAAMAGASLAAEVPPPAGGPVAGGRRWSHLRHGLRWSNVGLDYSQSAVERCSNAQLAQVFNRLGANALGKESFCFQGCHDGASLLAWFAAHGWLVKARLRSSIASFGFGAALELVGAPTRQIPLALPMRTGLLDSDGDEVLTLLPHSALELELSRAGQSLRLQWFQGTGGLCGWQGLNDLHRPWQNDRGNGTVRYIEPPFGPDEIPALLQLTELIALVHNLEASDRHLLIGGYGNLGFCIDSTALLQQALRGSCDLYPLLLPGLWRERLDRRCAGLVATAALPEGLRAASVAYRQALVALPLDLSPHGAASGDARRRLQASLPRRSPFALIQKLNQPPGSLAVEGQ